MSPEGQPSATASPEKALLKRQLASISKILAQASKNRISDLQKKHERMTTSPVQTRALNINGDPNPTRNSTLSGPMGLGQQHDFSNDTGSMVVQTDSDPATQTQILEVENDPMRMMAELMNNTHSSRTAFVEADNQEIDLDELKVKLSNLFHPAYDAPHLFADGIDFNPQPGIHMRAPSLSKECVPYAVALQLEQAGCDWQGVARFSKHLFNHGLENHGIQQAEECGTDLANMKLDKVNQQALKEETARRATEDVTRQSCRLLLTNIAADAHEDDILDCLVQSGFKFHT